MKISIKRLLLIILSIILIGIAAFLWFWIKRDTSEKLLILDDNDKYLQLNLKILTGDKKPLSGILDENRVLVTLENGEVKIFDFAGREVGKFGKGKLKYPTGIVRVDKEFWVCDNWNKAIQVFDENGNYIRSLGIGTLKGPVGIVYTNKKIWVADTRGHKIYCFSSDGQLVKGYGSGVKNGNGDSFAYPNAVQPWGNGFVVADTLNNRMVFWQDGQSPTVWDKPDPVNPEPASPRGIIYDKKGNLWILNNLTSDIIVLNLKSWQIEKYVGKNSGGNFTWNLPTSLTSDDKGKLVITDSGNKRVMIYTIKDEGK